MEVAQVQRLFENSRRRFNRRKKVPKPSGSGTADVQDAKERLKELAYLSWIEPYVQQRVSNARN